MSMTTLLLALVVVLYVLVARLTLWVWDTRVDLSNLARRVPLDRLDVTREALADDAYEARRLRDLYGIVDPPPSDPDKSR